MTTTHNLISSQLDLIYYLKSTQLSTLNDHFLSSSTISHLSNFLNDHLISSMLYFIMVMIITSSIILLLPLYIILERFMGSRMTAFIEGSCWIGNEPMQVRMVLDIMFMTLMPYQESLNNQILPQCNMLCQKGIISFNTTVQKQSLCHQVVPFFVFIKIFY